MPKKINKKLPMQAPGHSNDFQTPFYATKPLIQYIPKKWTIWECAEGKGNLSRGFRDVGYTVIGSDIITGQDFLSWVPDVHFDCIITNPPYSKKQKFLERAYELEYPFAFLMPLTALESTKKQRHKLFKKHGLEIIFLSERVNFETPSGISSSAWFATAWFTNWFNLDKQMIFEEIHKQ